MSKKVNELNTEDLESVSGGGYVFDRMDTFHGSRRLVFTKVGEGLTREDCRRIGDKLKEGGVDMKAKNVFGEENGKSLADFMNDVVSKSWKNPPDELHMHIHDDGSLGCIAVCVSEYSDYEEEA